MKTLMTILWTILTTTNIWANIDTPEQANNKENAESRYEVEWRTHSEYDDYRGEWVYSFLVRNNTSVYQDLWVTVWQEGWTEWKVIIINEVEPTRNWKNLTRKLGLRDNVYFEVARVEHSPSL